MIEWVYLAAKKCPELQSVVVATDDARIADAVKKFSGEVTMTRADHVSGFDRIVEVARTQSDYTHYVNIQGDEPLMRAANISHALKLFERGADIATTAVPFKNEADFKNENQVKVVLAHDGRALYFSRSPIPFYRKHNQSSLPALKHQGLYAYTRAALMKMADLPVAQLEEAESLEQLRFLYHGFQIYVHVSDLDSPGVDTASDADLVEKIILHGG